MALIGFLTFICAVHRVNCYPYYFSGHLIFSILSFFGCLGPTVPSSATLVYLFFTSIAHQGTRSHAQTRPFCLMLSLSILSFWGSLVIHCFYYFGFPPHSLPRRSNTQVTQARPKVSRNAPQRPPVHVPAAASPSIAVACLGLSGKRRQLYKLLSDSELSINYFLMDFAHLFPFGQTKRYVRVK